MIKQTLLAITLLSSPTFAQTEVYNEDFQSGLPAAYTIIDNDGLTPDAAVSEFADAWIELVDPDNINDTIMGSTSFFDPVGEASRWLITPAITLGTYGNIAYWEAKSHDNSFPDDYIVLVSSTDTQLTSFTDTLLMVNSEYPTWTAREGNLSELGLDNQTIHLAFVNQTYDGFKLYIDDIRVEIEDTASINELEPLQISVFPNPTNGIIHVSGIASINEIRLIGMDGTVLSSSTSNTIDLSLFASGRYLIEAKSDLRIARTLVIKN